MLDSHNTSPHLLDLIDRAAQVAGKARYDFMESPMYPEARTVWLDQYCYSLEQEALLLTPPLHRLV